MHGDAKSQEINKCEKTPGRDVRMQSTTFIVSAPLSTHTTGISTILIRPKTERWVAGWDYFAMAGGDFLALMVLILVMTTRNYILVITYSLIHRNLLVITYS